MSTRGDTFTIGAAGTELLDRLCAAFDVATRAEALRKALALADVASRHAGSDKTITLAPTDDGRPALQVSLGDPIRADEEPDDVLLNRICDARSGEEAVEVRLDEPLDRALLRLAVKMNESVRADLRSLTELVFAMQTQVQHLKETLADR